jgi:hypothetical protein
MPHLTATSRQYALCRILLGVYVAFCFARLIPAADDLQAIHQALAGGPKVPFPSWLDAVGSARGARAVLACFVIVSIAFACGIVRRTTAACLWYGWASLANAALVFEVPSQGYVGWLLLASIVIPPGEPYAIARRAHPGSPSHVPRVLWVGGWLLLAFGYTISGVEKLGSPSWIDGSAMRWVLEGPVARDTALTAWTATLSPSLLALATWAVLALELTFAPLACFAVGRRVAWVAMVAVHVAVVALLDIATVSAGMLIFHLFVLDPRWRWPVASAVRAPSVRTGRATEARRASGGR